MTLKMRSFFLLVGVFAIMGCQTTEGVLIPESLLPIKQTRITITNTLGEARMISENGREISTFYHDRKLKPLDITPKINERLYTKVLILGARRPYDITVQVHVERRDPNSHVFLDVGLDDNLTLTQARVLRQALNQSMEKTQVIDEGSPF